MSATKNEIRRRQRERLWAGAALRCHYCGEVTPERDRTVDHVVPKAFSGPDALWNLVPCCEPCNAKWADAVRKCECRACQHVLNRFHRERNRKDGDVVWQRKHLSDDEIVSDLLRRWRRVQRQIERLDDPDTMGAAALRGKAAGLREALSACAVNSVDKPEIAEAAS